MTLRPRAQPIGGRYYAASADPVTSREHILLARLLERAWAAGRDLELGALIREVQEPPIQPADPA